VETNDTKELLYKELKEIIVYDIEHSGFNLTQGLINDMPYNLDIAYTIQDIAENNGMDLKDTNLLTLAIEYLERMYKELGAYRI